MKIKDHYEETILAAAETRSEEQADVEMYIERLRDREQRRMKIVSLTEAAGWALAYVLVCAVMGWALYGFLS